MPLGILVVWHNVVVIVELFAADCAFPTLLDNLPVQQLPQSRPVTLIPDIPVGDADLQRGARLSLLFGVPSGWAPGRSKSVIGGMDSISCKP